MWPSGEPYFIEVHYPMGERVEQFTFSPKVIIREMIQLAIPASLLFGLLYLIGIPRFVLRFASDPVGYVISRGDPFVGPFVGYLYDPGLAILGTWVLCYIFFSVFAAVCWHYRYKHAYHIADITPEELQALQASISHQRMIDSRRSGVTVFWVERYEPKDFFMRALIQEFRSRKSLVRYVPFFRSWTDLPVEGSIGSVFGQVVLAICLALFAASTFGSLALVIVFAPIVLASSLFSFIFVWTFDISHEARASIALIIAHILFAYFWTSAIAASIGYPYTSPVDIRRILTERTKGTAEA